MREPAFLRRNKDKWLEYENKLFGDSTEIIDPDRLAELYVQLTDDLAYARTFYPKSQTAKYLNGLAARTHLAIYRNKKERRNRILTFWTEELPLIYRDTHKYMLYSFLIFTVAFVIGVVSTLHDDGFSRLILGESYIKMTIENIEDGNPTGVYQGDGRMRMFLFIAANNIKVSFMAFAAGILFSLGTVYLIFYNGVMVGTFLTLFHNNNVLWEALPIIYIHGTLELSAIVIAGGAGFALGNSILFPKTFTRAQSIQAGAKKGVKIMVGLVPVFIMAAFLEGFVTRLADMHIALKLLIIGASLAFIVWYYIIYPIVVTRELQYQPSWNELT
ncbi:MAG: stage II sporulation protein M [Bacteroidota bacterium]